MKQQNPIKKPKSTLSEAFKAFSLFIFVALFSFFGCIELLNPTSIKQIDENESSAEEGYSTSAFIMSLLETENIDATFSLTFTGANASSSEVNATADSGETKKSLADMAISLEGRVVYADDGLFLKLSIVLDGQTYSAQVGYADSTLYVITNEVTYKYDLSSYSSALVSIEAAGDIEETDGGNGSQQLEEQGQAGLVAESTEGEESSESEEQTDQSETYTLNKILSLVCESLNIDLDTVVSELSAFLGIDFENFSLNDFLTGIMSSPVTETETGCKIVISIGTFLSVQITCDENYNIKSIKTNNVLVNNNAFKFTAEVGVMNSVNMVDGSTETVVLPFEVVDEKILDLSGLGTYVGYAQNWFENSQVACADLEIVLSESEKCSAEFAYDGTYYALSTTISDVEILVAASDSACFVQVGDLKVKFAFDDYAAVKASIEAMLETNLAQSVVAKVESLIDGLVSEFEGENGTEEFSVEQIYSALLALCGQESLSGLLPTSTNLSEGQFAIEFGESVSLVLTSENNVLTSAVLTASGATATARFTSSTTNVSLDESQFADLSSLSGGVDFLTEILAAEGLCGSISLDGYSVDYEVDLSAMAVKVNGSIFGLDLAIFMSPTYDVSGEIDTWALLLQLSCAEGSEEDAVFFSTDLNELQQTISSVETWLKNFSSTTSSQVQTEDEEESEDETSALCQILQMISQIDIFTTIETAASGETSTEIWNIEALGLDFEISMENSTITAEGTYGKNAISLSAAPKAPTFEVPVATNAVSLGSVADLVICDEYKFNFSATYNQDSAHSGLSVNGTIIYSADALEIVLKSSLEKDGEDLKILIQDSVAYIFYGDLSYSLSLKSSANANTASTTSITTVLNNLLSDNDVYGVHFDFGVFESLMQIIATYEATDYLENLLLSATTSDGLLGISASFSQGNTLSPVDVGTFFFNFAKSQISATILGVLDVTLTANSELEMGTYDLASVTDELVDSFVNTFEVIEGVYAFSSDINIRYSTTTFSGQITAMIEVREDAGKTTYTPTLSVYTTAMNLSTYIYFIDDIVYIDINGLQIKSDISEASISEILTFLQTYFGLSLFEEEEETATEAEVAATETDGGSESGTTENAVEAVAAFVTVLPQIDLIYLSWSDFVGGLKLTVQTADELKYSASAHFQDIVAEITLKYATASTDEEGKTSLTSLGALLPTDVVLGANIVDSNTEIKDAEYYQQAAMDCETSQTSSLNFVVYLQNMQVGKNADLSMFTFENGSVAEGITSVASNSASGTTALADFNDISVLMKMVETVVNYVNGYQYQISLKNTSITTTESTTDEDGETITTTNETSIAGSVIAMLVAASTEEAETSNENGENIELTALDAEVSGTEEEEGETAEETSTISDIMKAFSQFKLQANLEIGTSDTTHKIDLLYEDDDEEDAQTQDDGLYLTYAHGDYIGSSAFKGYIEQASMSDIVSMIVSFAGLNLGETTMAQLELSECATNFTFLQSLLGIGGEDVSDDVSKMDSILQSVESMLALLNGLSLDVDADGNTVFTILIDMATLNAEEAEEGEAVAAQAETEGDEPAEEESQIATIKLVCGTEGLVSLSIDNLVYGSMTICAEIDFEEFSEDCFTYEKEESDGTNVFDLSSIDEFLDIAVETINTQNFNFSGSAVVKIGSNDAIDIGVDMYANISDDGDVYLYAELDIDAVYAVTWTEREYGALTGIDYGSYTTREYKDGNRISVLEYKDGVLSLTRTTTTISDGTDNLKKLWTFGKGTDSDGNQTTVITDVTDKNDIKTTDVMEMMAYILGLGTLVYDVMGSITFDINFTLEEAIKSFAATTSGYSMTLDGESLLKSSSFGDIAVGIGVASTDSDGNKYVGSGSDTKEYTFFDSIALSMSIGSSISMSVDLESVYNTSDDAYSDNDTTVIESYTTNAGKTLYTNDYYRSAYIKHMRSVTFDANGGMSVSTIYESKDTTFTLPTTTRIADDDGVTRVEYKFTGWYTDADCTNLYVKPNENGEYVITMPDSNLMLYAGWEPTTKCYHTLYLESNASNIEDIELSYLEDEKIALPSLASKQESMENTSDGSYSTTSYDFVGWYYDADLTEEVGDYITMGTSDITLYAKYASTGTTSTTYPVYVFDYNSNESTKLGTVVQYSNGDTIDLSVYLAAYSDNVKVYEYDPDTNTLGDEVTNYKNLTMGSATQYYAVCDEFSLDLGAYSITTGSDATSTATVTTTTCDATRTSYYQGETIELPTLGYSYEFVDTDDDEEFNYRVTYIGYWVDESGEKVSSYDENGNFVGTYVMPNSNTKLSVVWVEVETKYYYTIEFKTELYAPAYFKNWSYSESKWGSVVNAPESMCVLEGETVTLSSDCYVYYNNLKQFTATTWGLSSWAKYTEGGSGDYSGSYVVSSKEDTDGDYVIVFYACWKS